MHVPVMLDRCIELMAPALAAEGAQMVDATLGLGGHAEAYLDRYPNIRLLGVDRDPSALAASAERLARFGTRVTLVQGVHEELATVLDDNCPGGINGILFDLGVSSMQLDRPERGFSYARQAPLDMRMNPADELTAAIIVNEYPEAELVRVLRHYGEEKSAKRIAAAICARRAQSPLTTTTELADVVRGAIPAALKRTGGNPAKRTFQALRIEINRELQGLPAALDAAIAALIVGGRIAALAYHSLEDRIVKQRFARQAKVTAPDRLPVIPADARPSLRLLTRGAEVPSEAEVAENPRAASARLRAAERVREAA
ncbi:MAG: 16S rRNA (cytosine(1402)-N(4))-methyltransferase RsmH [Candidatus Nanopelagicales bacterium]|nr:16S rRNA (cytosine(1402)-N(4))-methyltransferase RsmH [Candidatus Nanopelagicales bacterium]